MPRRTTSAATSRRQAVLSRSASARLSASRMPKRQDSIHSLPPAGASGWYPLSDVEMISCRRSHGSLMAATSGSQHRDLRSGSVPEGCHEQVLA